MWNDRRTDLDNDIYAQRVDSSGVVQWTTDGVTVCNSSGDQSQQAVVVDGYGGALVSWQDNRMGLGTDIFVQHIDSSGAVLWHSDGIHLAASGKYNLNPKMASDGNGGAFIAWESGEPGTYDIYLQHIDHEGTLLMDPNSVVLCNRYDDQYLDDLEYVESYGALVSWRSQVYRDNIASYDVYGQRVDDFGSALWIDNGLMLATGYTAAYWSQAAIVDATPVFAWCAGSPTVTYAQGIIDEYYVNWGLGSPRISEIEDIPEDQGGHVLVKWLPSQFDRASDGVLSHYSIWRSLDDYTVLNVPVSESPLAAHKLFSGPGYWEDASHETTRYWEWVGNVDALEFSGYAFTSSTHFDSTSGAPAMHHFQVVAHSIDQFLYWKSAPDSGYSVDNLAPAAPQGLQGDVSYGSETYSLIWLSNKETDLKEYRVYQSHEPEFIPGIENYVTSSQDTTVSGLPLDVDHNLHVKLTAIDIHNNESAWASVTFSPPVPVVFTYHESKWVGTVVSISWAIDPFYESAEIFYRVERINPDGVFYEIDAVITEESNMRYLEDKTARYEQDYTLNHPAFTGDHFS